jgi:hypothetical protein
LPAVCRIAAEDTFYCSGVSQKISLNVAFNLTTKYHVLTVIISGGSVTDGLSMFPALEQSFGGHKVKEDGEVKTVLIRRLIMQNMEWHQQGTETWPPRAVSGPGKKK